MTQATSHVIRPGYWLRLVSTWIALDVGLFVSLCALSTVERRLSSGRGS